MKFMRDVRAWLPAILLAALVGVVFASLQGFGPESTLRKFHVAAVNRDTSEMQRLCTTSSSPQLVTVLQERILSLARNGYQYNVRKVQRSKDYVIAEVSYTHRMRPLAIPMLFVLQKERAKWLVNTDESLGLMNQVSSAPGTSY